jgi:hypothetical protein
MRNTTKLGHFLNLLNAALFVAVMANVVLIVVRLVSLNRTANNNSPILIIHTIFIVPFAVLVILMLFHTTCHSKKPYGFCKYIMFAMTIVLIVFSVSEINIYKLVDSLNQLILASNLAVSVISTCTAMLLLLTDCHAWVLFRTQDDGVHENYVTMPLPADAASA